MTEYVNENGENDPVEQVIALGEQPAAQLCLVSLCGIVRKLGNTLDKSWNEVLEALCHLYFLGLFPVDALTQPKFQLLSTNERETLEISLLVLPGALTRRRWWRASSRRNTRTGRVCCRGCSRGALRRTRRSATSKWCPSVRTCGRTSRRPSTRRRRTRRGPARLLRGRRAALLKRVKPIQRVTRVIRVIRVIRVTRATRVTQRG